MLIIINATFYSAILLSAHMVYLFCMQNIMQGEKPHHSRSLYWTSVVASLITGAQFWHAMDTHPIPAFLATLTLLLLMAIAVIDYKTTIIPDELTFALICCTLGMMFFEVLPVSVHSSLLGGCLGYVLLESIRIIYLRVRDTEGLGQGDPKLAVPLGLICGFPGIINAITVGATSALLFALAQQRARLHIEQIPFAPFLIIGTIVTSVATLLI